MILTLEGTPEWALHNPLNHALPAPPPLALPSRPGGQVLQSYGLQYCSRVLMTQHHPGPLLASFISTAQASALDTLWPGRVNEAQRGSLRSWLSFSTHLQ